MVVCSSFGEKIRYGASMLDLDARTFTSQECHRMDRERSFSLAFDVDRCQRESHRGALMGFCIVTHCRIGQLYLACTIMSNVAMLPVIRYDPYTRSFHRPTPLWLFSIMLLITTTVLDCHHVPRAAAIPLLTSRPPPLLAQPSPSIHPSP